MCTWSSAQGRPLIAAPVAWLAVQRALFQGFYVQLDYHGNKGGDQSFYEPAYFIDNWKKLLT